MSYYNIKLSLKNRLFSKTFKVIGHSMIENLKVISMTLTSGTIIIIPMKRIKEIELDIDYSLLMQERMKAEK